MKKIIGLVLIVLCCQVEVYAAPVAAAKTTIKQSEGLFGKRRNKAPRRKKGFMWGIFKKKSSCNCPNH